MILVDVKLVGVKTAQLLTERASQKQFGAGVYPQAFLYLNDSFNR